MTENPYLESLRKPRKCGDFTRIQIEKIQKQKDKAKFVEVKIFSSFYSSAPLILAYFIFPYNNTKNIILCVKIYIKLHVLIHMTIYVILF